jgi:acetyl esterase/lipase
LVTRYVIENAAQFNADLDRLVLAGDSAGGNIVAVLTQRMRKENLTQARIQVLIYPWLQMVTSKLPSNYRYVDTGITGAAQIGFNKLVPWYLGITNVTEEIENIFHNNELISFLEDDHVRSRILSHLNTEKIPNEYKIDKPAYVEAADEIFKYPHRLAETNVLKRDKTFARLFEKLFHPSISPLLADHDDLNGLPKAYFLVLEWDFVRDDGLLYASRLKEAGVEVKIAFYENGFHGVACIVHSNFKFGIARLMLNDLIDYLKKNL